MDAKRKTTDALGYSRLHLVGHDWGGAVTWEAAARYPDRLGSVTVVSTPHDGATRAALANPGNDQQNRSSHIATSAQEGSDDLLLADDARFPPERGRDPSSMDFGDHGGGRRGRLTYRGDRSVIHPVDRRTPTRSRLAAMLAVVAFTAAACGDGDDAATGPGSTTTSASEAAADATTEDSDEARVDCTTVPTGMSEFALDAGGAEHGVRVYMPTTYDGSTQLPLVMNFHGFGVSGNEQAVVTGYEDLAEEEGFLVVHPTAVPASGDEQRRNSWEAIERDDPAKDDLAFTNELLDVLIDEYCADKTRVYATGMSGGGLFTSQLVCEMSDRLAAASVAAISYPESCDPARSVPFMAIHGTEDETVPFNGDLTGTRFEGEEFAEVLFSEPMPDQFAQYAETMGCDPEGERVQTSTDIITTTYGNCDHDVPLVFYEVVGGGHAWPSSPLADRLADFQGYITFDLDATADSWAFFQQHSLES